MQTPLPQKSVRGSNSGIAIMALFDLLGRKWNMRILWELREGPLSFRSLQKHCDSMSPSVLNSRIKQLSEAKLLAITEQGYQLTQLGASLMQTLDPLRNWASHWEQEVLSNNK
ncbi:winged helix-turn-helix transcriptional regulator [Aliikangiella sp. IMCC44359]|uniref:winged helix-turn-helix transcriptional regulator n=1 Tax=Aliikangiella sp. IMCC44359 TaxID=3459125 RepID=UPI00403B3618